MAAALVASLAASLAVASAHAAFVPSTALLSSPQTYSALRPGSATRLLLPATSIFFGLGSSRVEGALLRGPGKRKGGGSPGGFGTSPRMGVARVEGEPVPDKGLSEHGVWISRAAFTPEECRKIVDTFVDKCSSGLHEDSRADMGVKRS
ncbi:hypothetical protein T484DRAFT_2890165 [Baffinella frigidus]|nr:hypothetical protein T484DRAFT_2890165 [Cryptophyta sp. CCMP2293]